MQYIKADDSTQLNSTLLIILQPKGWIKNIQLQKSKHNYTTQ